MPFTIYYRAVPSPAASSLGAYGLKLAIETGGMPNSYLIVCPESWTPWSFASRVESPGVDGPSPDHPEFLTPEAACLHFESGARVDISRSASSSVLNATREPTDDELVHPYLGYTAATVAWWNGQFAMHGACASLDGVGLGFLGAREQGKSTTIAHLVQRGWRSVADDMLVVDGRDVLAGPRCIDLREATATQWDMGEDIGVVGARQRWRIRTDPVAPRTPLRALIELAWGPDISIEATPVEQRLDAVFDHRTLDVRPLRGNALFGLLGVPFLRVTRPRDLASVGPMIDRILAFLAAEGH